MWGVRSQLPRTEQLGDHIKALRALEGRPEDRALFDHLYGVLTILDAKSASLLQFNAILIAVYSIYFSAAKKLYFLMGLTAGIVTILISSFVLLNVVWVHWSTTIDLKDPKKLAITLLTVRRDRTIMYRAAWYGASLSVLLLIALVMAEFLSRVHAFGF